MISLVLEQQQDQQQQKCRETMIPQKGEELDGICSATLSSERILIYIKTLFFTFHFELNNRTIVKELNRPADAFQVSTT